MSALGHVWTAPSWQGESSRYRLGRCSHVFGLLMRFVAVLVMGLSAGLDALLLSGSLVKIIQSGTLPAYAILLRFLIGCVILGIVAWIASRRVNVNRFSLHALYRNRLIRSYLGASRRVGIVFVARQSDENIIRLTAWLARTHRCA